MKTIKTMATLYCVVIGILAFSQNTNDWGSGYEQVKQMEQFVHEAENLTYYHASVEMAHSGYTGTGYVDGYYYDMDAFVEFEDASFGRNDIYLGIVFANEHSRPCELVVNGEVMDTVSFQGTGWGDWILAPVHIQSSSDISSIRLEPISRYGLPNIDKFIIAYENDVPEGATRATFDGGWNEANTPYSSFDGINTGEYIDIDSGKYSGFEFILYLDEDDTVDLTCRYACPEDMPAQILVNGVIQNVTMPFTSTGAWNSWGTASTYIGLEKGVNTVRIEALNDSGLPMIGKLNAQGYVFLLGVNVEKYWYGSLPIKLKADLTYLQTENDEMCFTVPYNDYHEEFYGAYAFIVESSNPSNESVEFTLLSDDMFNTDWSEHGHTFTAKPNVENQFEVWQDSRYYPYPSDFSVKLVTENDSVNIDKITVIGAHIEEIDCDSYRETDTLYAERAEMVFYNTLVKSPIFEIEYSNDSDSIAYGILDVPERNVRRGDTIKFKCLANIEHGIVRGLIYGAHYDCFNVTASIIDSDVEIHSIKLIGHGIVDHCFDPYDYNYCIGFDGGWNEANTPYSSFDGVNTGEYIDINEGIHSGFEFIVYAEKATTVGLWSEYKSPEDLPAQILVNGENTGKSIAYDSTTRGWSRWDTYSVELQKGVNTVRIEALTEGGLPMIKDLTIGSNAYVLGIDVQRFHNQQEGIVYFETDSYEMCYIDLNCCNNPYSNPHFIVDYSNPLNKNAEITMLFGSRYTDEHEEHYWFSAMSGINQHGVWVNEHGRTTSRFRIRAFADDPYVQINGITMIRDGIELFDCEELCRVDTIHEAGSSIVFQTRSVESKILKVEYVNSSGKEIVGSATIYGEEIGDYTIDIPYKATEYGEVIVPVYWVTAVPSDCNEILVEPANGIEITGVTVIGCDLRKGCVDCFTNENLKSDSELILENALMNFDKVDVKPTITSKDVIIEINSQKEYDASISVISPNGLPVMQKIEKVKAGVNTFKVNVEMLSAGTYQLIVVGNESYEVKQIVVE